MILEFDESKMGKSEESVLVVVRCRPLSSKEVSQELETGSAAQEDNDQDKHRGNGGFYSGCVRVTSNVGLVELKNPKADVTDPPKQFTFDAAYDQESLQKDLYLETFAPLVNSVLEGFNGTIFAYGQTGAGKTFTMEGVKGNLVYYLCSQKTSNLVKIKSTSLHELIYFIF